MNKQLARLAIAVALATSLLFFNPPQAAAHNPSCGDHPNRNQGFAISSQQSLTGEQVGNARVIMGIAEQRGLPRRAAEIAITASLQASSLRNSPGNNKGLFQQILLYYPGVAISSPSSATNAFYDRLVAISSWETEPIATMARTVQGAKATTAFTTSAPIATAITDQWWGDQDNPTQCPTGVSSETASDSSGTSSSSNSLPDNNAASDTPAAGDSTDLDQGTATTTQKNTTTTQKKTTTTQKKTTTTQKKTTTTQKKTTTTKGVVTPQILTISGTAQVSVGGIVVDQSIGSNLQRLLTAASSDGLTLSGSGWRNPATQIALRKQNCGTTYFAIYQQSASLCSPPTAIPGRSNHEKGLAVDFRNCSTRTTACYKWLNTNASKYGLYNLPSEPWHWSTNGL